jgi:hypothetical protein
MPSDPSVAIRKGLISLCGAAKKRHAANLVTNPTAHFRLDEGEADNLTRLTGALLKIEPISRQFTATYVRAQLGGIVSEIANGVTNDAGASFDGLLARLTGPTGETRIFYPLSGIVLRTEALGLPFGTGRFVRFDGNAVKGEVPTIIGRPLDASEESMLDDLVGAPGMEFRFQADHDRAIELGAIEIERVSDVLTFLASLEHGDMSNVRVGIERGTPGAAHPTLIVSQRTWQTIYDTPPVILPLEIHKALQSRMLFHNVGNLTDLLIPDLSDLTEFERSILNAVHWYAIAIGETRAESKIVSFITAGELFFAVGKGESGNIMGNFSDGIAFLLTEDPELDKRLRIRGAIESFYDLRSKVVHAGSREITESVTELRELIRRLIVTLLNKRTEFKTNLDLLKWLKRRRLQ